VFPGRISIVYLAKNEASKEFYHLNRPSDSRKGPGEMSSPILAYKVSPSESAEAKSRLSWLGASSFIFKPAGFLPPVISWP
jgi:hypothetical protein